MTPTSQDRHAAVNAFANRVAKYVTEEGDPEWSPYRCAVEAVTVAMQDAWYEVEAIGSPAAAPTPSPDPERPTREQIARTAYEACHGSWGDITDGLREMYLAEADAVLALFGDGASPVPQPQPAEPTTGWTRPRDEHGRAYYAPNETPPADERFAHWQGRLTHPEARCNRGDCVRAHEAPSTAAFRCYGGWIPSGDWWLHCSVCRPAPLADTGSPQPPDTAPSPEVGHG